MGSLEGGWRGGVVGWVLGLGEPLMGIGRDMASGGAQVLKKRKAAEVLGRSSKIDSD